MARKGVAAVRELLSGTYDGEIEAEDPKPVTCIVPKGDSFVFDVADPDARIVRGSAHFDDLLPHVQERGCVVPYRRSRYYKAHLRRGVGLNELRRLLPRLQTLRKKGSGFYHKRAAVDGFYWSLWSSRGITANDALLLHVIADARYQPSFWAELREEDPNLIEAIERACRPGTNKLAGRKPGVRSAFPTPAEQQAMRASAKMLLPQVKDAKRLMRESRKDKRLMVTALQQFENIARPIRSTLVLELKDRINLPPKDIVIFLVAKKHGNKSLPHTKKILSGIR